MSQVAMIARLIAVLVAIVGAFVGIPYAATILIVLGVVASVGVEDDQRVLLLLSTMVLMAAGMQLAVIPAVGDVVATIIRNLGLAYLGASLGVILTALARRLKP